MVFNREEMVLNRKNDYKWADGMKWSMDANTVGGIVEYLERKDGAATSKGLLEVAKDENSPIHKLFIWDDAVAAEKYRLHTSKSIINSLRIVVKVQDDYGNEQKILSAFVNIRDERRKAAKYMTVVDALNDDDTRNIVLNRMYKDMKSFADRYALYSEAANVIEAINQTLEGVA